MRHYVFLLLIGILFFSLRSVFYLHDFVPTGYDAGIYVHVLKTFPPIPSWLLSSYYSALFLFTFPLLKLGILAPDGIVFLGYLSQVIFFLCVYVAVRKVSGRREALVAVLLLSVSAIQLRAYWFFYLKYILSVGFLVLYLSFLGKKEYVKAVVFGFVTAILHLLTGCILLLAAGIDIVLANEGRKKKTISLILILVFSFAFYIPVLHQMIILHLQWGLNNLINLNETVRDASGGAFYLPVTSLFLMALYIPLSLYGLRKVFIGKQEVYMPFIITFFLTLVLIILQVSFFKRIVIITDVMLLVFAAIGFSLVKDIKKFYIALLILFAVLFSVKTSDKLISSTNLSEIQHMKGQIGQNYILSTAKEDTAWLLGYTDAKVIAWNYGGYNTYWTDKEWELFFNPSTTSDQRQMLLRKLPKHTYIYGNDVTKVKLPATFQAPFVRVISPHFYRIP